MTKQLVAYQRWRARYKEKPLKILDLCTGTGCIALQVYHDLHFAFPHMEVLGIDISSTAIQLARQNLRKNINAGILPHHASENVSFEEHDVFSNRFSNTVAALEWDIILSNPPYVSPRAFDTITSRSVRTFEPKLALVPPSDCASPSNDRESIDEAIGDSFYARILGISSVAKSCLTLFEVGDMAQAKRVVAKALAAFPDRHIAIWRDLPDLKVDETENVEVVGRRIPVYGQGHARTVLIHDDHMV